MDISKSIWSVLLFTSGLLIMKCSNSDKPTITVKPVVTADTEWTDTLVVDSIYSSTDSGVSTNVNVITNILRNNSIVDSIEYEGRYYFQVYSTDTKRVGGGPPATASFSVYMNFSDSAEYLGVPLIFNLFWIGFNYADTLILKTLELPLRDGRTWEIGTLALDTAYPFLLDSLGVFLNLTGTGRISGDSTVNFDSTDYKCSRVILDWHMGFGVKDRVETEVTDTIPSAIPGESDTLVTRTTVNWDTTYISEENSFSRSYYTDDFSVALYSYTEKQLDVENFNQASQSSETVVRHSWLRSYTSSE